MFDVGFAELFLLALIGLLVLGPERLPGVARTVGGFVRKARTSWISLRRTIESELAEADISEPLKKATDEFKQIGKNLTDIPGFSPENTDSYKTEEDVAAVETPGTEAPPAEDNKKTDDV